jgi:ElaB/YqjD/DUF883 family membrane-anchored ribosome-binding protein
MHRKPGAARAWQPLFKEENAMATAKDNTANGAAEDIAAQLRRLQDDLAALKETLANVTKSAAEEAAESARQQARSVVADAEDFARKNPRAVLGGAVALGFALGLMLRRH